MSSTPFVLMYHPQLGNRQVSVSPGSVDDHALRGWLLVDPGVTPPAPTSLYTTVAQVASQLGSGTGPIGVAGRAAFVSGGRGVFAEAYPRALAKLAAGLSNAHLAPCRFVVTGSSTSAQNPGYVAPLTAAMQTAYPSGLGYESPLQVSNSADFTIPAATAGVQVYNAAQGSTFSSDFLTSTEITKIAALNPAAVLIMIGSNNYNSSTPIATYKSQVQGKIDDFKAQVTSQCVYILVHSYQRTGEHTPAWAEYGQALREIADADPNNVAFSDVSAPFYTLGVPAPDPLDLLNVDGTHLNTAGYALLAEELCRALGIPGPRRPLILAGSGAEIVHSRLFSDAFSGTAGELRDRVGDGLLGGPVGKAWAATDTLGQLAVATGQLTRGAGTLASFFGGVQIGTLDAEVGVTVVAMPVGGTLIVDLHRASSSVAAVPDSYRVELLTTGQMSVRTRIGGTSTTLATGTSIIGTYAAGNRITLRYYRGWLTLLVNGIARGSWSTTAITAAGWAGISGGAAVTSLTLDNFTVDALT